MVLICSKPLITGDVVIDCKPIIHNIMGEHKSSYCDNCLKSDGSLRMVPSGEESIQMMVMESLKKCSNCRQMYYCSRRCQRQDWKWHKNECKLFADKQRFKPNQCIAKEWLLLRLWFCSKSVETFATERHQLFDGSDISLNEIEVNVEELAKDSKRMEEFDHYCNQFKAYGLEFERKELLHWFGILSLTPSLSPLKVFGDRDELDVGVGLYIQLASFNHSCCPNSAVVNNGFSLQLRAIKPIESGQQITINYISLFNNKIERQLKLKTKYYIDCKCEKCEQNLDSDVDYSAIDSIKSKSLETIETANYDRKAMFDAIMQMSEHIGQVLGEYHPIFIRMLFNNFLMFCCRCHTLSIDTTLIDETFARLERNITLIYGSDHPFYQLFRNSFPSTPTDGQCSSIWCSKAETDHLTRLLLPDNN